MPRLWRRRKCCGILSHKPVGKWNNAAEAMLKESVFSVLKPIIQRYFEKQKGGGKNSFHFIACFRTAEILLKTIVSVAVEKMVATAECVFTDSVLCLGGQCQTHPRSREIMGVVEFDPFRELFDIAGEPVVFVWRIYPGRTAGQLFQDV